MAIHTPVLLMWSATGDKPSIYTSAAAMGVKCFLLDCSIRFAWYLLQIDKKPCVHNAAHAVAIGLNLEHAVHVRHTMGTWRSQCSAVGEVTSTNVSLLMAGEQSALLLPPPKPRTRGRPKKQGRSPRPSEKAAAAAKKKHKR